MRKDHSHCLPATLGILLAEYKLDLHCWKLKYEVYLYLKTFSWCLWIFFLFYIFDFFKDIYSEYARPPSSVFESYIFLFNSFKFFVLSIYFSQPSQMFLFVLECTKQSLFTFLLLLMWVYFLWWIYISLPFILWILPAQLSWFSVAFTFSPWNSVTPFLVLNSLRTFKIVDLLTRDL